MVRTYLAVVALSLRMPGYFCSTCMTDVVQRSGRQQLQNSPAYRVAVYYQQLA